MINNIPFELFVYGCCKQTPNKPLRLMAAPQLIQRVVKCAKNTQNFEVFEEEGRWFAQLNENK